MRILRKMAIFVLIYLCSTYVFFMLFTAGDGTQVSQSWYGEVYDKTLTVSSNWEQLSAKITLTLDGEARNDVFAYVNGTKTASFGSGVVNLKVVDGDLLEILVEDDDFGKSSKSSDDIEGSDSDDINAINKINGETLHFRLSTTSPLVDLKFLPLELDVSSARKIWSRIDFVK